MTTLKSFTSLKQSRKLAEILSLESADKVEPKFKVGDWVVNTVGDTNQVVKVFDDGYTLDDNTFISNSWATEHYHLWAIEDANNGNVLVYEGEIFMIKFYALWNKIVYHCCYDGKILHKHSIYDSWRKEDFDKVHPATKEQRDLLFQKMEEAGYEWDYEKKELKKIEQKPTDETPYPETLEKAIDLYYYSYGNGKGEFEHLSLEKFRDIVYTFVSDYGQKPAWSEEDERLRRKLIELIYSVSYCDERENLSNWLKSLKQRLGG